MSVDEEVVRKFLASLESSDLDVWRRLAEEEESSRAAV